MEFSTADFFTSGDAPPNKTRAVPSITAYPPSQHAINTRNSMIGDLRAKSAVATGPRRANSLSSPISYASPNLKSPIAPLAEEHGEEESLTSQIDEKVSHRAVQEIPEEVHHEPSVPLPAVEPKLPTDSTVELRKKVREAEQKTINVLIEYQQKVDKSRKRIMELENRLQEEQRMNREYTRSGVALETYLATPPVGGDQQGSQVPVHSNTSSLEEPRSAPPTGPMSLSELISHQQGSTQQASPPAPSHGSNATLTESEMQVRIASLEAQREQLRGALKALRTNKDLEIAQFKQQVLRLTKTSALQRALQGDPFMMYTRDTPNNAVNHDRVNPSIPSSTNGRTITPTKQNTHRRSYSSHPAFYSSTNEKNMMVSTSVTHRPRNSSMDLTSDSSYTSPMSVSSNGTIHSVSSSSSTSSTSSNGSTGNYYEKQALAAVPALATESGLPRRIGVGPFLPLGLSVSKDFRKR